MFAPLSHPSPAWQRRLTLASAVFCAAGFAWLTVECLLLRFSKKRESPPPSQIQSAGPPQAFLENWCYDCHGDGAEKGSLALDTPGGPSVETWRKLERHVLLHTMPPMEKADQPSRAERLAFSREMNRWLASLPPERPPAPLRRLNRREYARSVRDLPGLEACSNPAADLPEDEPAHGFDNNADFQPLPPVLMERYLAAASKIAQTVLLTPPPPRRVVTVPAEAFQPPGEDHGLESAGWCWLADSTPVRVSIHPPVDGEYEFRLTAFGHQAGDEPARAELAPGVLRDFPSARRAVPDTAGVRLMLKAGPQDLSFRFANPFADPAAENPHRRYRHLLVRQAELEGPLDAAPVPAAAFFRLFPDPPPAEAALEMKRQRLTRSLETLAERAWRRPLRAAEVRRLETLAIRVLSQDTPFHEAAAAGFEAILTSPHFLFLTDPSAAEFAGEKAAAIAARLSYFLTGSPPDAALRAAAARGWTADSLRLETLRLLASPAAESLAEDFAGQWLQLRNVTLARPDAALFPEADAALLADMQEESRRLFMHLVRENEPVLRLADATYTFLNRRLAAHYGLPFPEILNKEGKPDERVFLKMSLNGSGRRGFAGHASVLTLTSQPNRTSPVMRGKWVLEALLGLEPPPQPANVPALDAPVSTAPADSPAENGSTRAATVRETLERHRADPACASCHRAMDPPGFVLEAFDATGRRTGASANETTATVFTGQTLKNADDLSRWLTEENGERLVHHIAERLLTYALGRGLSDAERLHAHSLADACGGRRACFRDLILAITGSPVFRGE